jgi:hypothetical protein
VWQQNKERKNLNLVGPKNGVRGIIFIADVYFRSFQRIFGDFKSIFEMTLSHELDERRDSLTEKHDDRKSRDTETGMRQTRL